MHVFGTTEEYYGALEDLTTLAANQDSDLKVETEDTRVWLPRVTADDAEAYGMPEFPVCVEIRLGHGWAPGDEDDLHRVLARIQDWE